MIGFKRYPGRRHGFVMARGRAWAGLLCLTAGGLGCDPLVPDVVDTDASSDGGAETVAETGDPPSMSTGAPGTTDEPGTTDAPGSTGEPEPVLCGNGLVDPGEQCDGLDLQGATCESLGHLPGTLGCSAECMLDDAGCIPPGMVFVPGGVFEMGTEEHAYSQPVRMVDVDAFYIDRTEVTVEAYRACESAGVCGLAPMGISMNSGVPGRDLHPVNGVTWYDAEDYCGWVDGGVKRLPTEAEWEKAARGTDARWFPWGDAPEASCMYTVMEEGNVSGCGLESTWPVGSMPLGASPYGALDMSGNVYEWVSDFLDFYDQTETDNPTGPETGDMRVLRGGAWMIEEPLYLSAIYRGGDAPIQEYAWVGIRCARGIE